MSLKRGGMQSFEVRKQREKGCNYIMISKIKKNTEKKQVVTHLVKNL